MSLALKCDRCGRELISQGALVFGPPIDGTARKRHVCVDCWRELWHWIERGRW